MIFADILLNFLHGLGQKKRLLVTHELEIPEWPGARTQVTGWSHSRKSLRGIWPPYSAPSPLNEGHPAACLKCWPSSLTQAHWIRTRLSVWSPAMCIRERWRSASFISSVRCLETSITEGPYRRAERLFSPGGSSRSQWSNTNTKLWDHHQGAVSPACCRKGCHV